VLGAIAGDVIGSVHEWAGTKTTAFELWPPDARPTDDTVLTLAVAEHLLTGETLVDRLHAWARAYPDAGYGGRFRRWVEEERRAPYGSWGNGSAMRVSPVGFAARDREHAWDLAAATAAVTHDHPDGVRGARAVALAIRVAREGADAEAIQRAVEEATGYDLAAPLDELRPGYGFDVSCQGSVPPAIRAALEARSVEQAIRLAISLGGDADTMACIAGGVAQARFGLDAALRAATLARLDGRMRATVQAFEAVHPPP
jgi:ADP-ribosylglycohydrolase